MPSEKMWCSVIPQTRGKKTTHRTVCSRDCLHICYVHLFVPSVFFASATLIPIFIMYFHNSLPLYDLRASIASKRGSRGRELNTKPTHIRLEYILDILWFTKKTEVGIKFAIFDKPPVKPNLRTFILKSPRRYWRLSRGRLKFIRLWVRHTP